MTDVAYILDVVARAEAALPEPTLPEEPEYLKGIFRGVKIVPAPERQGPEAITVEQARERITTALNDYLACLSPAHMVLIKALPGVGKTTAAVFAAEALARQGRRVLYAGPRHDFFGDIMAMSSDRSLWYEWLPRQKEDAARNKVQTCNYCDEIGAWMQRGYRGIDFCKQVCGWDYMGNGCVYHAQKQRPEPLIFGQHQHVALGHPMRFHVVLGDEFPIPAFLWAWHVPARWVNATRNPLDPMAPMARRLESLCKDGLKLRGPALLQLLGGPDAVLDACRAWMMPVDAEAIAPEIHSAGQAETVPYAYLQHLVPLLVREAEASQAGRDYPHRILLDARGITLYLRHKVDPELPEHVVWLDATAHAHLYEAVFQRRAEVVDAQPPVAGRILQLTDRANGKASLLTKNGEVAGAKRGKGKAWQLEQQVAQIVKGFGYERPAIISYKGLVEQTETFRLLPHTHYYAARGTNALEDVDCLVIGGVPQPPLGSLEYMAKMIFFERMQPFDLRFCTKDVPYNYVAEDGQGRAYPVAGFWHDPDLQAVLWSVREAEIIQAAHRCRPVNHAADVWLLLNLPIDELPPARLLTIADLFGAPEDVNAYLWPQIVELAERLDEEFGAVTAPDLAKAFGITRPTAARYIRKLQEECGWEIVEAATRGNRGRPGVGARRLRAGKAPE